MLFYLANNSMREEGSEFVGKALKTNHVLETLYISYLISKM